MPKSRTLKCLRQALSSGQLSVIVSNFTVRGQRTKPSHQTFLKAYVPSGEGSREPTCFIPISLNR